MVATRSIFQALLALAAAYAYAQEDDSDHGEEAAQEMGPVAFMWPPDRVWGAAQDNTAPCGSAAGVTNRTEFPLLNGVVSLVAQDESWSIQIAVSHSNDPTSNDDFEIVTDAFRIPQLSEGHQCYPITNPGPDIEAGFNATIQIRYTSDFDNDRNETFYACTDIIYVSTSQFTTQVPCFNATVDDFEVEDVPDDEADSSPTSTAGTAGASATSTPITAEASGSSGLSGGAIAGIVVGVVGGVALVLGALFFLWRRSQRQKRASAQGHNPRKVDWEQNAAGSQSSGQDVELHKLPRAT